ncbi:phosphate butyryltransferase [Halobacillus sp. Marseille-Q1614]|uniref:phosphate butyryltransferase n=1 Tax=Halobacillus sp. Marseille-Q1614 TaxID=2709134 RepID=UPI0015707BF1|nr:phosphate butyryltransferase [Halobacillus sp. Marseille-Q1614]
MKKLQELIDRLQGQPPKRVAIAQAADEEVLKAVKKASDIGMATFLLTGDVESIKQAAHKAELDLTQPAITIEGCEAAEASSKAVKAVKSGDAQVVMKGKVDTKSLLKAVLNKENGLRGRGVLSHVALFEIPHQERLIFLTDSAMNIAPTLEEKVQIVKNAVGVAVECGWKMPKVAPLAAVEVINPAMPATLDAAALTQMNRRGQITNCIIDGPLAFDNAVSKEAASQKSISSEAAGAADILMVHSIEAANALYKSFIYFAQAKVAAVISGAEAPIVLTSRSDSAESKLYSLALALNYSTK